MPTANKILLLIFLCFSSTMALSAQSYSEYDPRGWEYDFSASLETSLLRGKSKELVYLQSDGRKLSELAWDLTDVPMLGLKLQADVNEDWIVTLGGWRNIGPGSGIMVDTDWRLPSDPNFWTDQSIHNVDLVKGEILDFSLAYRLLALRDYPFAFRLKAGLRYISWKWEDFLISTIGSSSPSGGGLRDISLPGSGERGIDYSQWFTVPYLGAEFESTLFQTQVIARGSASSWVFARDRDFHRNRQTLFEESATGGRYYSLGIELKRMLFELVELSLAYDFEQVREVRADTLVTSLILPPKKFEDGAGISYRSQRLTLGIIYNF
ncbi:Uncharacterized protein SCG7109_AA_00270 [Chlamydiales bacterium SCGC AG-110-M15]|nr:Uncharacterized protein SCG7109_AA_00270 [Chlamydiales bacterium SCGC AG-110-M15]